MRIIIMLIALALMGCASDPRETVAERNARWANAGAILANGMSNAGAIYAASAYTPQFLPAPYQPIQPIAPNPYLTPRTIYIRR